MRAGNTALITLAASSIYRFLFSRQLFALPLIEMEAVEMSNPVDGCEMAFHVFTMPCFQAIFTNSPIVILIKVRT